MAETKFCTRCGKKLSRYNRTGKCHSHAINPGVDTVTRFDRIPPVRHGGIQVQEGYRDYDDEDKD